MMYNYVHTDMFSHFYIFVYDVDMTIFSNILAYVLYR